MGAKASGTTRKTTATRAAAKPSRSKSAFKKPSPQTQHSKRVAGRRTRFTEKVIAGALTGSRGMVATAARALGCDRNTIYSAMERWPALKELVEQQREVFIDVAEFQLQAAVAAGEAWAVCFALKCLAKDRGYVERLDHRHSGADGGPVEVTFRLAE